MSTQYRDGTFSETLPLNEALPNFMKEMERNQNNLKAFHVGSFEEIEEVKTKATLQSQIDLLAEKMESMEPITSDLIHIPNKKEVKQFSVE